MRRSHAHRADQSLRDAAVIAFGVAVFLLSWLAAVMAGAQS